jgi:membrane-associated protease RseP (regulator of RpoE activity)
MPLIYFIAAGAVGLALHLGTMALLAKAFGIAIRRVSYGLGPTLYSTAVLQIKALPLSGHVKFKDSREESLEVDDRADAFNHQPIWKQVVIPLAGNACLVLFAVGVLGSEGWASFVRGFFQVFEGALSPLGAGQSNLESFQRFVSDRSLVAVFALVASKLAAVNLLPFGAFNGGQMLMTVVRFGRPELSAEQAITRFGILLTLILLIGWLLALGSLLLGHAS